MCPFGKPVFSQIRPVFREFGGLGKERALPVCRVVGTGADVVARVCREPAGAWSESSVTRTANWCGARRRTPN